MHGWDPLTRLEETLRFLDDAVRAGKINYVGLSNFTNEAGVDRTVRYLRNVMGLWLLQESMRPRCGGAL